MRTIKAPCSLKTVLKVLLASSKRRRTPSSTLQPRTLTSLRNPSSNNSNNSSSRAMLLMYKWIPLSSNSHLLALLSLIRTSNRTCTHSNSNSRIRVGRPTKRQLDRRISSACYHPSLHPCQITMTGTVMLVARHQLEELSKIIWASSTTTPIRNDASSRTSRVASITSLRTTLVTTHLQINLNSIRRPSLKDRLSNKLASSLLCSNLRAMGVSNSKCSSLCCERWANLIRKHNSVSLQSLS